MTTNKDDVVELRDIFEQLTDESRHDLQKQDPIDIAQTFLDIVSSRHIEKQLKYLSELKDADFGALFRHYMIEFCHNDGDGFDHNEKTAIARFLEDIAANHRDGLINLK
jgi:hypothetical protein